MPVFEIKGVLVAGDSVVKEGKISDGVSVWLDHCILKEAIPNVAPLGTEDFVIARRAGIRSRIDAGDNEKYKD